MTHMENEPAGAGPHPSVDTLGDLADGALTGAEREAVELHVAACAACAAELQAMRALLARASALPLTVEPPPAVWDGVRVRLTPRVQRRTPRVAWTLAAAAVLLLVALTVLPGRSKQAQTAGVAAATMSAELARADAEYVRAAAELRAALDAQRATLAPATVATVEASLRVVDDAIAEARQALVRDPGNAVVANMLAANHEQKLDLLRRATRLLPPS